MSEHLLQAVVDRQTDRFYGKYRGLVTDNDDPLKRGRLKALVPAVLGEVVSGYAEPCVPYAGTTSGFYAVPPIGAGVWIEFEGGDPSRPVWVGCWWATGEAPMSEKGALPTPFRKILRSETGLMVELDDTTQTLSVTDIAGLNIITLKVMEGTVEIKGLARVILEAPLIQHGANAQHPAVFGDQLLSYLNQLVSLFNSHVHAGQMAGPVPVTPAPPLPSFTPATPSLLSIKNMVG